MNPLARSALGFATALYFLFSPQILSIHKYIPLIKAGDKSIDQRMKWLMLLTVFRIANATPTELTQHAIEYLDKKPGQWVAERKCISCHTGWSYGFARIGTPGWENSPVKEFEAYIQYRQTNWDSVQPWYPSRGETAQGSEAVVEASLLAEMDRARGLKAPSDLTRLALKHMLELQEADGAFPWLDYQREPLQSADARIFGAAMAQIALSRSGVRNEPLNQFLRNAAGNPKTPLYFRLVIAWAAAESGQDSKQNLAQDLIALQNADGGWSLNRLNEWKKQGDSPRAQAAQSDANATSFALMVLSRLSPKSDAFQRAQAWLKANQTPEGNWAGTSVNYDKAQNHEFMGNLATAFTIRGLLD